MIEKLLQEGLKIIVGPHCCAAMALDHTNATVAFVMWREDYLRNISVFQTNRAPNQSSYL
jgi:hypothetical protein